MTCDKYSESISAFIDGELDDSERKALEEHLDQCSQCRSEYNRQLQISKTMRKEKAISMPPDTERKIAETVGLGPGKIESRAGILRGSYNIPRPVAWVAAAALIVLTINTIFFNKDDNKKDVPQTQSEDVQTIMLTEADMVTTSTRGMETSDEGGKE